MVTKEQLLEVLRDYIEHFDNPYWTDLAIKEWLDSEWIPEVRRILVEVDERVR